MIKHENFINTATTAISASHQNDITVIDSLATTATKKNDK